MARRRFRLPPIVTQIGEALAPFGAKALYSAVDSVLEDVESVVGDVDARLKKGRKKLGDLGVSRRSKRIKEKKASAKKPKKKKPRVVEAPLQNEEE